MARYIDCEKACAEVDKGDLLVGNNAEWAKEIINRTPTADVAPKSEVAREIFEEIENLIWRYYNDEWYTVPDMGCDIEILKKKYTEEK